MPDGMNAHVPPGDDPPERPVARPMMTFDGFEAWADEILTPPFVSKFEAMFWGQVDDPGEEFDYIIDGVLSKGERSVIGGASQSGKSFLAVHAGMCIATGIDFFNCKVEQGLVIYQIGEGRSGFRKRMRAWRKHFAEEMPEGIASFSNRMPFVVLRSPIDLYEGDDTPKLIDEIRGISRLFPGVPLRAIFIDTLATAQGAAEENSGKDMGAVLGNIAKLSAATGAHVCLVHHMNASGTKIRGHTIVYSNVDQVLIVTKDDETKVRTAELDKQRDDEAGLKIQFELMGLEVGVKRDGSPATSCVCLRVGEKESVRREEAKKGFRIGEGEVSFMKAYFTAEKAYGIPVPEKINNIPDAIRSIVPYSAVKNAFKEATPSDETLKEDANAAEKEKFENRHTQSLARSLRRYRDKLTSERVVDARTIDGVYYLWWTGKPLRAFPHTLPAPPPAPVARTGDAPDLSNIPF